MYIETTRMVYKQEFYFMPDSHLFLLILIPVVLKELT